MKPTALGSSSSYICLRSTFPLHFYSDLLNQKIQKYLAAFYLYLFYLAFDLSIYYNLPHVRLPILRRRTPEGIGNPFNSLGCEVLLFVCWCCLCCVAWLSYWSHYWGKYVPSLCYIVPSSLRKYQCSSSRHQKEFLVPLPGRIININQVPNHKSHLLAIYSICHLPLVFLSHTSQKFVVLFAW